MLITRNKYDKLQKSYENLLKLFAGYKLMFNHSNCNTEWKYNELMVRAIKLKKENEKNTFDKKQMEKLSQKLSEITQENNRLKLKLNKTIQEEVNKRVNEEINLVFRKNSKINEELLQSKEELKWAVWYFNSLKEIYLSEGLAHTKNIILEKLKCGIPECYREMFDIESEYSDCNMKIESIKIVQDSAISVL